MVNLPLFLMAKLARPFGKIEPAYFCPLMTALGAVLWQENDGEIIVVRYFTHRWIRSTLDDLK
jgi:hypothetical protein